MLGSRLKGSFVMMRKTISMPDQMADWIASRIERGQFNNESEYFRDLVRRDQEDEDRKAYLISRLESGTEQLANGAYSDTASDEEIDRLFDAE
jgi:antitoxin ParD1/3/4